MPTKIIIVTRRCSLCNILRLFCVQLTQFAGGIPAIIIINAVGHIRILLDFGNQDPFSDSMDCAGWDIEAISFAWIKEHPLDFDWTDEMEEANQQVQYQIYANKMLSYLKKNASAKEQFDTAVRFAIQYDVVDENNNVVTSYEPKIKFTMSLLANLELKIIFGTVPDALECHSYEEAVEHRNQFYEIVKKYSLGEVTGNQCVLNKMYDDMFAQKGSYAFYIQWLNNEFPSEVEYQKKLQETKGLKKILVMATKPNHLATIE